WPVMDGSIAGGEVPSRSNNSSASVIPPRIPPVMIIVSTPRPAEVTGKPVMASSMAPTRVRPASRTMIPAATSWDGLISMNSSDRTAKDASAQPAAMNPPATCWKNAGRPHAEEPGGVHEPEGRDHGEDPRDRAAAELDDDRAAQHRPAQHRDPERVRVRRGHDLLDLGGGLLDRESASDNLVDQPGHAGHAGHVDRAVVHHADHRERRAPAPSVDADHQRGERDLDGRAGQAERTGDGFGL